MAVIPTADDVKGYSPAEFAQIQAVIAAEAQRRYVLANVEATGLAFAQAAADQGVDIDEAWSAIRAQVQITTDEAQVN